MVSKDIAEKKKKKFSNSETLIPVPKKKLWLQMSENFSL